MQRTTLLPALVSTFLLTLATAGAAKSLAPGDGPVSVDHANRIGVIVKLSLDPAAEGLGFVPEGNLPHKAAVAAQRAAIEHAQTALLNRLKGKDIAGVHRFQYIPYVSMYASDAALEALEKTPGVAAVHLDRWSEPALAESIPLIGANMSGNDGSTAAVAVLDSGVESGHLHLWGLVLSEACYSTNEDLASTPGVDFTSICPGEVPSATGVGTGEPCTGMSICSHGTHVAGIAAGGQFTGGTYQGVARLARLISIKIYSQGNTAYACYPGAPPCLRGKDSDIMKGLERVLYLHYNDPAFSYYHIAAVNMSFGSGQYTTYCDVNPLKTAIDNLRAVGIASVVASGNAGYTNALSAPACISTAISVGNSTKTDTIWSTSNSASFLNLLAPGTSIYSPDFPGGAYSYVTGTSFAAPHVAGAMAQLKHKNPNATVSQMLDALTSTGVPILDTRNNITKPRIQVDAACALVQPAGQISASPTVLVLNAGQVASSQISWNTSNLSNAQVWVSKDGEPEKLMSGGPSGSVPAGFITSNRVFQFNLYADTSHSVLLDYELVFGIRPNSGQIWAHPRTLSLGPGQIGTTKVVWATDGLSGAEVWVAKNGGAETLMASLPPGLQSADAAFITRNNTYEFRLYAGTSHTTLLDTVTVVGVPLP